MNKEADRTRLHAFTKILKMLTKLV